MGFQKHIYKSYTESRPSQLMEQFLLRMPSLASGTQDDPPEPTDPLTLMDGLPIGGPPLPLKGPAVAVTVEVLDVKLQTLLQDLTHNIIREVGKIAHELKGEITQLGGRTDTLENKFDELVQYVHILEEDNAALKHTVSPIQIQQEDLENREHCQNLQICGVHESITD